VSPALVQRVGEQEHRLLSEPATTTSKLLLTSCQTNSLDAVAQLVCLSCPFSILTTALDGAVGNLAPTRPHPADVFRRDESLPVSDDEALCLSSKVPAVLSITAPIHCPIHGLRVCATRSMPAKLAFSLTNSLASAEYSF